jgi:hypothetical protein
MNPLLGWGLALLLLAAAWQGYGWEGVLLAVTVIVFWLLLQFNRSVRVMKNASQAPVGHVDSAVMLNAKLKPGMTLLQVITLTKSLGRKLDETGEAWEWQDTSGSRVQLYLKAGKLQRYTLERPAQDGSAGETPPPAP